MKTKPNTSLLTLSEDGKTVTNCDKKAKKVVIPKGVKTIGNHAFYYCTSLESLTIHGKKYNTLCADGSLFIIKATTKQGRTTIHEGANFNNMTDGKMNTTPLFFAVRGKFGAHGETAAKAVEDLKFKIVAEKMKNDPIYPDTVITTYHYRMITGACEVGCSEWKKQNGITVDKMKAKDLLVLLEKTNAYGVQRFKELLKK